MKKEMKEMQEWIDDEGLSSCPFCGETANPLDDLGRIRWMEGVRIKHSIKRCAWAELMPEELRYRESYAVCCATCGGSGGYMATIEEAREAWNRRAEPGKPTYSEQHKRETEEALKRLSELTAGL